jgi:hypothetical protein
MDKDKTTFGVDDGNFFRFTISDGIKQYSFLVEPPMGYNDRIFEHEIKRHVYSALTKFIDYTSSSAKREAKTFEILHEIATSGPQDLNMWLHKKMEGV